MVHGSCQNCGNAREECECEGRVPEEPAGTRTLPAVHISFTEESALTLVVDRDHCQWKTLKP